MDENRIRQAIAESLSQTAFPDARQKAVFERIKGEKPVKKKLSLALVCALILTLALAGAALAAVLGVFGQLSAAPYYATSAQKLEKLDQAADFLNVKANLEAPAPTEALPEPQTIGETVLKRQYDRRFELTLNQSYFDGNKLYYSYTLETDESQSWQGEGLPTGIEEWLIEESGKRYQDVWSNDIPGRDNAIQSWLNGHESSWIAFESWGLGDGAQTADGIDLQIIEGDSQLVNERTLQGYQVVEIPEELAQNSELNIELTVLYGASLYHQDETGVRWAHIAQPENRGILRIPFTVYRNGQAQHLQGEAAFADYAAKAGLSLSDVEISGKVILKVPADWTSTLKERIENVHSGDVILDYHLMADGEMLRDHGCSLYTPMDGRLEIEVAYDLPASMNDLLLIPEYAKAGLKPEEAIPIK